MALAETTLRTGVDLDLIEQLSTANRHTERRAESELAWDLHLRAEVSRSSPRLPNGELVPVAMLDPATAPPSIRDAVTFWHALPRRVDAAIRGTWPPISIVGRAGAARLALLAWRCDADNDLRRKWVAGACDGADPYVIAMLRDRTHWIDTGTQLYGTISVWTPQGARPRVPIDDKAGLHARRDELGLRPLDEDATRHLTETVLLHRLGAHAGFDAASAGRPRDS